MLGNIKKIIFNNLFMKSKQNGKLLIIHLIIVKAVEVKAAIIVYIIVEIWVIVHILTHNQILEVPAIISLISFMLLSLGF